ncbi:MAG: hypothetical protein HWN65_02605 [Candidatus Helarchaeota archaeon]|nr:hypothetical protein [Candidatus Helarchaeota archaeon]
MKTITLHFLHPHVMEIHRDPIDVTVDNDADVIQAIAAGDRFLTQKHKGKFPLEGISSFLQLVWDPNEWTFFEDVGIEARDAEKAFIPLRDDPTVVLPPGSDVKINPDAGC